MPSLAFQVESIGNTTAAGHEARGLLDKSHLSAFLLNVGEHAELTHVSLYDMNCWIFNECLHVVKPPRPRRPWVFMEEMLSSLQLVSVQ